MWFILGPLIFYLESLVFRYIPLARGDVWEKKGGKGGGVLAVSLPVQNMRWNLNAGQRLLGESKGNCTPYLPSSSSAWTDSASHKCNNCESLLSPYPFRRNFKPSLLNFQFVNSSRNFPSVRCQMNASDSRARWTNRQGSICCLQTRFKSHPNINPKDNSGAHSEAGWHSNRLQGRRGSAQELQRCGNTIQGEYFRDSDGSSNLKPSHTFALYERILQNLAWFYPSP